MKAQVGKEFVLEDEFSKSIISKSAIICCLSAVKRMRIRETVWEIPGGRAGIIELFIESELKQCM